MVRARAEVGVRVRVGIEVGVRVGLRLGLGLGLGLRARVGVDVRAEVDLTDVVILQHRLITRVRRPVGGDVVERAAGRESDARLEAVLLHQLPVEVLCPRRGSNA